MENSPLEFLARKFDNVIMRDANGIPSVFVKFPKMLSSDLDASLPNHTHPAFIIDGVEQDYILLGKYKGCCLTDDNTGTLYSLPNMPPVNKRTHDQLLEQCKAFGSGITGMTQADYGLLMLLAVKNGFEPQGNTRNGSAYGINTRWTVGASCTQDSIYTFRGYTWQCLISHTAAQDKAPPIAPDLWKNCVKLAEHLQSMTAIRKK